ncbi:hypothetical protein PX554_20075 [Sphingomonas sp. H39-1-10]|uniref:hypothetical protein n=1 Tax=Sphingomonas pollutisoli TaxID=3030829 RepID=UPI0023B9FB75|nr:hypothetical protein [Sphingomonas pollutisoli]MDF0490431.1 hypothetical protein [Sphingomonas pollutisoli]
MSMTIELCETRVTLPVGARPLRFWGAVMIDGQRAFLADNHTRDGRIRLRALRGFDRTQVDAELAHSRPPVEAEGHSFPTTLELEVAMLADRAAIIADLRLRLRDMVLAIEQDRVRAYPATPANRMLIELVAVARTPDAVLLEEDDPLAFERAADLILGRH